MLCNTVHANECIMLNKNSLMKESKHKINSKWKITIKCYSFFLSLSGYHYTHVVEANVSVPSTLYA